MSPSVVKQYRLNRLFHPTSGRCFDVAVDHGMPGEAAMLTGIEDMAQAIDTLVDAKPDAIQLSVGQADLLQRHPGRDKPALVLRTDTPNIYAAEAPAEAWSFMIDDPVGHAVRLDAACVVVNLLDIPGQDGLRRDCLEAISQLRAECDRAGMPLMVEPLAFEEGGGGGYESSGDIDRIMGLVRQAVELGADVIKADPTDDISEYHRVVQVARVPLLLRGGGRVTDEEILERTHAVLEQGAAGIVYGRNVIQHEQPGRDDAGADVRRARRRDSRRGARAPAVSVARIGIVGGGLMGRELAAAIGRWAALTDHPVTPRLEAVCDTSPEALAWFERVESVRLLTGDRDELLNDPDLDVLYLAVPHHLHEELYLETIAAGKDFLGEKPFGIDLAAGRRIVAALDDSTVFARCSSEMPYFPGAQLAYDTIRSGALGELIEVEHAFLHSSDLDRAKPINWKRQAEFCGEAGVMNDLGMHVLHLPLRLGWRPDSVHATLRTSSRSGPAPTASPFAATPGTTPRCTPTPASRSRSPPSGSRPARPTPGAFARSAWTAASSSPPPTRRWSAASPSATGVRCGSASRPAANPRSRPSPGRSSSSASPTRSCRCGRPSSRSARRLGDRLGCVSPQEVLIAHEIFHAALESGASRSVVTLSDP